MINVLLFHWPSFFTHLFVGPEQIDPSVPKLVVVRLLQNGEKYRPLKAKKKSYQAKEIVASKFIILRSQWLNPSFKFN